MKNAGVGCEKGYLTSDENLSSTSTPPRTAAMSASDEGGRKNENTTDLKKI